MKHDMQLTKCAKLDKEGLVVTSWDAYIGLCKSHDDNAHTPVLHLAAWLQHHHMVDRPSQAHQKCIRRCVHNTDTLSACYS